jgi:hypothetical protein
VNKQQESAKCAKKKPTKITAAAIQRGLEKADSDGEIRRTRRWHHLSIPKATRKKKTTTITDCKHLARNYYLALVCLYGVASN